MSKADILMRTPKAIAHLRGQLDRERLGLIFGSGASHDLGFPNWNELVTDIAAHPEVNGAGIVGKFVEKGPGGAPITRSLASITQILFNEFRKNAIERKSLHCPLTFLEEQGIKTEWLKIVHGQLYKRVAPGERSRAIASHVYLPAFRAIIKKSPLTVNYNFDDTLEKMLLDSRVGDEKNSTRGYEVTDKPDAQFQNNNGVIYHPNGYLPAVFEDGASSDVVFSDDSFQDQLTSAAAGKHLNLSNHLFRNTCLLIGLSLDDVTLQNLLRQNAVSNPGNVHYIVHFRDNQNVDSEVEEIIFRSNFSSYNLYTLFLDGEGIRDLADLISMTEPSFALNHRQDRIKFVYYLIGSIGSGKSTAASKFRSLVTYDEWIDERRPDLAVPESTLPAGQINDINPWVFEQFRKENFAISGHKEGIHLVDRSPLDPLTFGTPAERPGKARALIDKITDNDSRKIEPGHVIFLDCDLSDVKVRSSLKHKYWPDQEFERLLNAMAEVYGGVQRSVVCTRGRTATQVAHEIATIIFLDEYRPIDICAELSKFAGQTNAA